MDDTRSYIVAPIISSEATGDRRLNETEGFQKHKDVPFSGSSMLPRTYLSQAAMCQKKSQLGLSDSAILSEISTLTERLRLELNIERRARIAAEETKTTAEANLIEAHQKIHDLEATNKDLEEELEAFKAERQYTEDLRRRYDNLETNHNNLKEKIVTLESMSVESFSDVQRLEAELSDMKEERDSRNPIYQVGLEIRVRFTEQARESVLYVKKIVLDNHLVILGNAAAHGGRGEADVMILLGNHIPREKYHTFATVFKELYRHEPAVYNTLPKKLKEAIDCEASIRTLKSLNDGRSRPLLERQLALENVEILCAKYPKLSGEDFDQDVDVNRRLSLIKSLTQEIVEWERKSVNKGAKDTRRPDTSY